MRKSRVLIKKVSVAPALTVGALLFFCGGPAKAAIMINALEVSGNVIFTYSGKVNTAGLIRTGNITQQWAPDSEIIPFVGQIYFGNANAESYTWTSSPSTFWSSLGAGGSTKTIVRSGPMFGINGGEIFLQDTYSSNDSIAGSMTFALASFSSLGLSAGTYTATLPNDTVTMNIGPVPTPAPLPILGLPAAFLSTRKLRKRIKASRENSSSSLV